MMLIFGVAVLHLLGHCLGDNTVVETTYGPIQGIQRYNSRAWTKIPYAKPPLAELRFEPPQTPEPWNETLLTIEDPPGLVFLRMCFCTVCKFLILVDTKQP